MADAGAMNRLRLFQHRAHRQQQIITQDLRTAG